MQSNAKGLRRSHAYRWLAPILVLVSLWVCVSITARAQTIVGSMTGIVSDPTGAVVPGAKVTLTDTNKGYTYNAVTDGVGRYLFSDLPASTYNLRVEFKGFKTITREGIVLEVAAKMAIDVRLEIGATTQAVEVTAAAPLLSTQDAVTGQEVDRSAINELPLVDRSVLDLAFLAPGVIQVPGSAYGFGTGLNFVSNGGRNDTTDLLIDGITASSYEPNTNIYTPLFQPNVDAVQEFKIMQNNYSAEEGFSGNTYINMVMRSGTNGFHGDVYEFARNKDLDSQNYFANETSTPLPAMRRNQFGGSIGGPIKKDKTFFFFDYDGVREASGDTRTGGVPSQAERNGDFSELCTNTNQGDSTFTAAGICNNSNYQLWDPYSGIYVAGTGRVLQTPIPFNNMANYTSPGNANLAGTVYQLPTAPGNLIDPVAANMIKLYPMPNTNVGNPTLYNPYNNWSTTGLDTDGWNQWDLRIDHRFGQNDAFNARYSQGWGPYHEINCYGNMMDPCTQGPGVGGSRMVALSWNHTFSPSTIVTTSLGFTRGLSDTKGIAKDFPSFNPVTALGVPSYMTTDTASSGVVATPNFYMYGGYFSPNGPESLGAQPWSVYKNGNQVYHLLSTLTKVHGRHELKFGGEWRVQQQNWFQDGAPEGVFIQEQYGTSQYPWWGGGDAMASFLTGVPDPSTWGEYEISPHFDTQNYRWGGFAQDTFKATPKLTVNVGMRYDLEIPRTERHNKEQWLNLTLPVPISPTAIDPTTWPTGLPGGIPNVTSPVGGLVYASNSAQRRIVDAATHDFGPRLGIAYRLRDKLVFRTGYGLFYNPTTWGSQGAGVTGNEGWESTTGWLSTMNGDGVTPWGRISNPFPTGLLMPSGSSLGVMTNLGLGVTEPTRNMGTVAAYSQTWSGGFQYQLPGSWFVEVNYVGTKGTHLFYYGSGSLQYLGPWVEQEATNANLRAALGTYVPNPYYGVINTPGCGICGSTIQVGHLLEPFPQFNGFSQTDWPVANSIYHAFQSKIEKRMSHGLNLMVTYTISKSIDDASLGTSTGWIGGFSSLRDPNDLKLERSLSEWDLPQLLQFSYIWQVPYGRGKHWGGNVNPVLNYILGGWQTSGMWRFDNGQPISIGVTGATAPWGYSASYPDMEARLRRNPKSEWLTQGYFANAAQALIVPPPYSIGNASRVQPNLRVPGTSNATMAIFKDIPLNKMREGSKLQFRVEAFNALNHPQFGGIGTTFGNPIPTSFGDVTAQVNTPRQVQLGLQLYF